MNQPNPTESKPLVSLSIKNFQRIKLAEFNLEEEGVTQVRGKNEHGKSSVLDGVLALLCGRKYSGKSPIHDGEDDAELECKIGDLTVRREYSDPKDRSKTKLTVTRDGGGDIRKPQTALDELVGSFPDPVAIINMSDAQLTKEALAIVGAGEALDLINERVEKAMSIRRDIGREHKAQKAVAGQFEEVEQVSQEALGILHTLCGEARDANHHLREASRMESAAADRLAVEENELAQMKRAVQEQEGVVENHTKSCAEASELLKKLQGQPAPDLEQAEANLEQAKETNRKFEAMAPMRGAVAKEKELAAQLEDAEKSVESARAERDSLLSEIEWPSEALSYDTGSGCVFLNGRFFSCGSTAEKTNAAVDMITATDVAVPLILVRHGNDLDAEHLAGLDARAKARGWKVLLERVDDNMEGPGIYLENGEIK